MFSAYVSSLRKCPSYESGITLAKALPSIQKLTASQVDELVIAYNETSELRGCWAFNGEKSSIYGPGLVSHINRFGVQQFKFSPAGSIQRIP